MNANKEIKLLFENHGFSVEEKDEKLFVEFEDKIEIQSRLSQRQQEDSYISRLDIRIELPNGQAIIESYGDIADSSEIGKQKNIQNFMLNSFHVIIACFSNNKKDEQITFEEWTINGTTWEVYIGNFGLKGNLNEPIDIPDNLFNQIEILVKQKANPQNDFCWARTFYAQHNEEISAIELLIDNETYEDGQSVLYSLKWDLREEYYSIRNFLILKKKAINN